MALTPQLLASTAAARQRYQIYLNEQRKQKVKEESSSKKRILEEELHYAKLAKKPIQDDIRQIEESAAISLAKRALETRKMSFLAESNCLGDGAAIKKKKLEQTENRIGDVMNEIRMC